MSAKDTWTPYGLEAIRIRYLRRRRLVAIAFALGLAGMWLMLNETVTTTQTEIFANGERAGSGISIERPEEKEDGPVTVSITPGRVTRAESAGPTESTGARTASAPVFQRGSPINYEAYVIIYGPFILLALAAYFLSKKRGRHDQVNYGVYKGSMPLELLSASMSRQIFTTKMAKTGLFGKRRADYLPDEVIQVERVPQEEA